jgi:hypothetical protein
MQRRRRRRKKKKKKKIIGTLGQKAQTEQTVCVCACPLQYRSTSFGCTV